MRLYSALSTQLRRSSCRLQYHRMVDSGCSPITSLTEGGLEEGHGYRGASPQGVHQVERSQGEASSFSPALQSCRAVLMDSLDHMPSICLAHRQVTDLSCGLLQSRPHASTCSAHRLVTDLSCVVLQSRGPPLASTPAPNPA